MTQGCRLNQSETASLEQSFKSLEFNVVCSADQADIAVVNTCTVTENGDADTRKLVNKLVSTNSDIRIALIGCQAQVHKDDLLSLKNVQWVIGNEDKMRSHHIIDQSLHAQTPLVRTQKIARQSFRVDQSSVDSRHKRANIKIQDGCDFYCAFCVIPFARGPARSRVFEDIVRECIQLGDAGHKEIVITGINVGTYEYDGKRLADVIKAIAAINTIHRIRISSIEPTTIDKDIILMMNTEPKLCRHLHIPLQSGSDEVLSLMARKYNMDVFRSFVQWVYEMVPGVCIGTDVIVGFPGESKALFDETVANLITMPIHYMHVFSYSERKFARSKRREDKVNAAEIARRSRVLRDLSLKKRHKFNTSFKGKSLDVLVETKKKGFWSGLTDNYIRVLFEDTRDLENTITTVEY